MIIENRGAVNKIVISDLTFCIVEDGLFSFFFAENDLIQVIRLFILGHVLAITSPVKT